MGIYIVKDNGAQINAISIEPAQVERYAALTGYELVPYVLEEPAVPPATDVNADMEQALNELGVETRE